MTYSYDDKLATSQHSVDRLPTQEPLQTKDEVLFREVTCSVPKKPHAFHTSFDVDEAPFLQGREKHVPTVVLEGRSRRRAPPFPHPYSTAKIPSPPEEIHPKSFNPAIPQPHATDSSEYRLHFAPRSSHQGKVERHGIFKRVSKSPGSRAAVVNSFEDGDNL
jgi:hypothetical protein